MIGFEKDTSREGGRAGAAEKSIAETTEMRTSDMVISVVVGALSEAGIILD